MNTRSLDTLAGAVHRKCRCPDCYAGHARWVKERREAMADGTWQPWTTDLQPVRAHLEQLHNDEGMSWSQIARLSGLHRDQVWEVRTKSTFVRPDTAAALLAVRPSFSGMPGNALVPGRGAERRVKALRAIGWTGEVISAQSNVAVRILNKVMLGNALKVDNYRRIAVAYEHLHDQNPRLAGVRPETVARGIRYARRRSWAPPSGWEDIDLDAAPKSRTEWSIRYAKAEDSRANAVIEQTAELAAQGETREQIAKRIGISWGAITTAHSRADVDVPEIAEVAA